MAQRWIAPRFGGIEVLELVDVDVPEPGEGEVTIRATAIGVNPSDAKTLGGGWNPDPAQLPLLVGQELAGAVTAVGPNTRIGTGDVAVGDAVIAFKITGGFATEVTVAADAVFARPETLEEAEAANILHVGVTAADLLHLAGVAGGDTLLVHGASGSVGVSVLQQAALAGVRVIGTASASNFEKVRGFGAEPVAYGDGLADRVRALAPKGVTAAIDAVGTDEALEVSLELVCDPARIATLAPGPRAKEAGVGLSGGMLPTSAAYRMAQRARLLQLAADGELVVPVARTFPFAEAPAALAHVSTGHPGGKVALIPEG
jgi:NADPH2:quinone reductase